MSEHLPNMMIRAIAQNALGHAQYMGFDVNPTQRLEIRGRKFEVKFQFFKYRYSDRIVLWNSFLMDLGQTLIFAEERTFPPASSVGQGIHIISGYKEVFGRLPKAVVVIPIITDYKPKITYSKGDYFLNTAVAADWKRYPKLNTEREIG